MTPKEKAEELVDKYIPFCGIEMTEIQCALIAVNEILKEHYPQDVKRCEYWQEVKQEIENL